MLAARLGSDRGVLRLSGASAVALATVLVYAHGLPAPFVFDDLSAIVDNANLRQLLARVGDATSARAVLVALLEQPFLLDRIHLELGLLQLRLGQDASAHEHFARALSLTSDRAKLEARVAGLARAR